MMHDTYVAGLLKKEEYVIDGEKKTFYKYDDSAILMNVKFNSSKNDLVVLSGKYQGKTLCSDREHNKKIFYCDIIAVDNNNTLDIPKFIEECHNSFGGNYYTHHGDKGYKIVKDKKILNQIAKQNNEYNADVLDETIDISKMYSSIKETIISQDEQIMQILTSLFKNQKVVNSKLSRESINKLKENIIVYGPTGTGKTEILQRIAKIYDVPIVIEDATSFTETGYVGREITSMLEDLYLASDKDIDLAQKGILVIDEFDKLAEKEGNVKDHVSRIGVQRSLLKLLDGSTFYFKDRKFDTSKLSVVALGAFDKIAKDDEYKNITTTNFVEYGIMRELMGRFSKLIAMNALTKEDLKSILINSNFSPINTYKELFDTMNIKFSYDDSFIDHVAEKAVNLNSGARSLKTIVDNEIGGAMFRIFAGEYKEISLSSPTEKNRVYTLKK